MARDILDRTEARVREILDLADITVEAIDSGHWEDRSGNGYPFLAVRFRSDYDLALAQSVLASHRVEYWTRGYNNTLVLACLPNPERFCSRLVQGVQAVVLAAEVGHEDVYAWKAPSECHALVDRRMQEKLRRVLARFEITPAQYGFLVEARTSDRWAYYNANIATVMTLGD